MHNLKPTKVPALPILGLAVGLTACLFALYAGGAEETTREAAAGDTSPDRAQLEQRLSELMTDATMVGHFTVTAGPDESSTPRAERYTLKQVKKVRGDYWLFQARIQYGDHDVTVPLTLPVRWAGDTPVITVDDIPVPGLGTFTARVVIYEGHYAGFWRGAGHGGHLYGVIERGKKKEKDGDE